MKSKPYVTKVEADGQCRQGEKGSLVEIEWKRFSLQESDPATSWIRSKRTISSILLLPLLLEPQETLDGIDDAGLQIDICPFISVDLVALFCIPARWVHIIW